MAILGEEEEVKMSQKGICENSKKKTKENNDEVSKINDPSLHDFESLLRNYDRLKQVLISPILIFKKDS